MWLPASQLRAGQIHGFHPTLRRIKSKSEGRGGKVKFVQQFRVQSDKTRCYRSISSHVLIIQTVLSTSFQTLLSYANICKCFVFLATVFAARSDNFIFGSVAL